MKKEIMLEMRQEERRRRFSRWLTCATFKLLLLVVPLVIVAGAVAKTGLWEVPYLTDWLYQPSTPTRTVIPLTGYDGNQVLAAAMARASFEPGVGVLTIKLSEQELTTLARESAASTEEEEGVFTLPLKMAQMTCSPEGIELFAVTPRDQRNVTIKTLFNPSVDEEGKLDLAVKTMQIGGLKIPNFMVEFASRNIANRLAQKLIESGGGAGDLVGIRADQEMLEIDLKPELKLPF